MKDDLYFKTGTKSTYFNGVFFLRDNTINNWADPIEFPTALTAFGNGIKSGNWRSCTSINTPQYVIDNYFDGKKDTLKNLWECAFNLEKITWADVENDKQNVLRLIDNANNELLKLAAL